MAESKEESVISLTTDKEIDENVESLHISPQNYDFEGKVILECMLEGNELPDTTNESTAIGVSNQQYEGKIEDVVNDASPNETNISTAERYYTETCKGKAYINKDGENKSTNEILSKPITTDGIYTAANYFCKTCEDPHPVSENCGLHHVKGKLCMNHENCENIKEFQEMERNDWYFSFFCKDIFFQQYWSKYST